MSSYTFPDMFRRSDGISIVKCIKFDVTEGPAVKGTADIIQAHEI